MESRMAALLDAPRPGQTTEITAEKTKKILNLTVHHVPRKAPH